MKLLYDCVSSNPGDVVIGQIELEHLRARGLSVDPQGPDYSGDDTLIIGGGHLLQRAQSEFHSRFKRKGRHILYAMGVSEGIERLEYLNDYKFVSVRTRHDSELLQSGGGPRPEIIPCPANLLEADGSLIDAAGMIGVQSSSREDCECYHEYMKGLKGRILAFPWRRNLNGLLPFDDLVCAERIALLSHGEVLPTGLTPGQLIDVIRQLDFFICHTLHGAIWAYQSGVDFLVQGYAPKVYYWAEERGLLGRVFHHPIEIPEKITGLKAVYPTAIQDRENARAGLDCLYEIAVEALADIENGESRGLKRNSRSFSITSLPNCVDQQVKDSIWRRNARAIGSDEDIPLVSIVMPVFNHLDLTCQCLGSIYENTEDSYEIIVVDNGSTDGTGKFLEGASCRVVHNQRNQGYPRAINQGIEAARGQYICLVDNDTILLPCWLTPLLKHLSSHPEVGMVGPKQINLRGRIYHVGTIFYPDDHPTLPRTPIFIYQDYPQDHPLTNVGRSYPAMNFSCILIRRRLFEEVGFLDDKNSVFPGNMENVDWCFRMRKAGYSCYYLPESKIVHIGQQTQFGSGDELKRECERASAFNLAHMIANWNEEPESFFVPPDIRELIRGTS